MIALVLLILALIVFLLAAFGVDVPRVNMVAIGLALAIAAEIAAHFGHA
jgi:hypothetical protein